MIFNAQDHRAMKPVARVNHIRGAVRRLQIANLIKSRPHISASELATETQLDVRTVYLHLQQLDIPALRGERRPKAPDLFDLDCVAFFNRPDDGLTLGDVVR